MGSYTMGSRNEVRYALRHRGTKTTGLCLEGTVRPRDPSVCRHGQIRMRQAITRTAKKQAIRTAAGSILTSRGRR